MARKALRVKCALALKKAAALVTLGKPIKKATRLYHRCEACGRAHGYIGSFRMCRICVREKANAGELMGVRKSSW